MVRVLDVRDTKLGRVAITCEDEYIVSLMMNCEGTESTPHSRITDYAFSQLDEYLSGKRRAFDVPLKPKGTDFQRHVWEVLQGIPYGQTITYKGLAELCGNPEAARAIGGAMRANPIPVFIPCHRVITSNGKLGGYSCGLNVKRRLLELEGIKTAGR